MLTAAALLALFAVQPLHGPAVAAAVGTSHAVASIATDAGVATGAHHADLCPLCAAASLARATLLATPQAALTVFTFRPFSLHASAPGPAHTTDLCASGPRAPPRSLAPLV